MRSEAAAGVRYVLPAMLLIAGLLLAPTLYGVYFSLFDVRYAAQGDFVGLDNYRFLLQDPYLVEILVRSFLFTAAAVALTLALALAVALWIDSLRGWFAILAQILVILPWVISHVVGALLFRWVFVNEIGLGIYALERLGITGFQPLSDPYAAMAVLIVFACWRTLGFTVILLLAGLKSIPADYYEAARVDGATARQRLVRITLPLLRTPMLIAIVVLALSNLNNVEAPLIVTGGGPAGATNIIPLDIYTRAFVQYDFNAAIALGIGMFAANIVLAVAYVRLVRRDA